VQQCDEAIAFARAIPHTYSLALAHLFAAMVHQHRRDASQTQRHADAAITLATEFEFGSWLAWGRVLRGWALAHQGNAESGIAELRRGIEDWNASGCVTLQPCFLAFLAEAYASNEQSAEALTTVIEALAIADQTEERYFEAELYRLKGKFVVDLAEAEHFFQRAIEIARRQGAKSFELRAVLSLCRLQEQESHKSTARQMLEQIYSWFTEGFDTADLKETAAFLNLQRT
jgi:predicted ATPase